MLVRRSTLILVMLLAAKSAACTAFVTLDDLADGDRVAGETIVSTAASGAGGGASAGAGGAPASGGAAGAAALVDPYRDRVLADAPLAYWRLGDEDASVAHNEIGATDHGQFVGNCILGATGAVGGVNTAVQFPSTSCRIEIGDAFHFQGGGAYSFEVWVMPFTVDSTVRRIFSEGGIDGAKEGYSAYFGETFTLFTRVAAGNEVGFAQTMQPLQPNRFTHLVATYDGRTTRLYLDAVLVAEGTSTHDVADVPSMLVLGDTVTGGTYKLNGVLDEVAIYSVVLPQERIAAHFEAGQ